MTIPQIISTVAAAFGITPEAMLSPMRDRHIVIPRQVAMLMSKEYSGRTLNAIGGELNRHHGTVIYGIEEITGHIQNDKSLAATVGTIRATIVSVMASEARAGRTKSNVLRPSLSARMAFPTLRAWRVN